MDSRIELREGDRCHLGSYRLGSEERVLFGEGADGTLLIYDQVRSGAGPRYLVESGVTDMAELAVFLSDYKRTAIRLGRCPMVAVHSREA